MIRNEIFCPVNSVCVSGERVQDKLLREHDNNSLQYCFNTWYKLIELHAGCV